MAEEKKENMNPEVKPEKISEPNKETKKTLKFLGNFIYKRKNYKRGTDVSKDFTEAEIADLKKKKVIG